MFKVRTATRLAFTFGILAATITWTALAIRMVPNPQEEQMYRRIDILKSLAMSVTSHAENRQSVQLKPLLRRAVELNDEIISVGVTRKYRNGYQATFGPHEEGWMEGVKKDPRCQLAVEILTNGNLWGELEVRFRGMDSRWWWFPYNIIVFVGAATTFMSWLVMDKTFKYLNPSNVVPGRVRSALDTLAEGLVLVDPRGEIAHANQAFQLLVNQTEDELLGGKIGGFNWVHRDQDNPSFPWELAKQEQRRICGTILQLEVDSVRRLFVINATPILGQNDSVRGVLVSFDDVTELESKNEELAKMIVSLQQSSEKISKQNEELNFLASYDPLTSCMNRRAFFGRFENYWKKASENQTPLAIIILDVDHFKAVNDNHGHSVGDEVLVAMGQLLRDSVGEMGLVCRYGGEEFVVLLPDLSFDESCGVAENLRKVVEATEAAGINFTASFGISSVTHGSMDPQHMLDQADESLYAAKRNGRNQVVRFDEVHNYTFEEVEGEERPDADAAAANREVISYSAVTGLLSALSFRCRETAEHSIRVADLCVAVGERIMSKSDVYKLEVAALLHDIGKIGVPDSILHKPGPLTDDEWKIMRKHDLIGVEIVGNAFASPWITEAIEYHHYHFTNSGQSIDGEEIPLASRIITACDAFDAMTNDRVYRKAMSEVDAVKELARNTPHQFDPVVVTQLVEYVQQGLYLERRTSAGVDLDSRSAANLGKYIEQLQSAVAEEDVDALQNVVESLRLASLDFEPVTDAASRLDEAINDSGDDLEKVIEMANEVMELCRASRTAFVDVAEHIIQQD